MGKIILPTGITYTFKEETGKVSDFYHTFDELYENRNLLFLALIKVHKQKAWRASRNANGDKWEGWFIAGINPEVGKQITYHLPEKFWSELDDIETYNINPYYDGHSSKDVLQRLKDLI